MVRPERFELSCRCGHTGLGRARIPFRHERINCERPTGLEPADLHLGKVTLYQTELQPHGASGPIRTDDLRLTEATL
jgi:hypothetical protein